MSLLYERIIILQATNERVPESIHFVLGYYSYRTKISGQVADNR